MRHILAFTLALGPLAGCAGAPVPRTSAQAVYAVETGYTVAARAEASYIASPGADPRTIATIRRLDNDAYAALVAVRIEAQQGRAVDAAKLALAEAAVGELQRYVAGAR